MPTSGALDRVAEKLNLPFFEVYFVSLIIFFFLQFFPFQNTLDEVVVLK